MNYFVVITLCLMTFVLGIAVYPIVAQALKGSPTPIRKLNDIVFFCIPNSQELLTHLADVVRQRSEANIVVIVDDFSIAANAEFIVHKENKDSEFTKSLKIYHWVLPSGVLYPPDKAWGVTRELILSVNKPDIVYLNKHRDTVEINDLLRALNREGTHHAIGEPETA